MGSHALAKIDHDQHKHNKEHGVTSTPASAGACKQLSQ